MVNLITQCIFTVTAYHEVVGGISELIAYPTRAGWRIAADDAGGNQFDVQNLLLQAMIGCTTAMRMPPLMSKFENFFGAGGAPSWERNVWDDFIVVLEDQSKKVKEANVKRSVPFVSFDPEVFECSISV